MSRILLFWLFLNFFSQTVFAQRDPPSAECNLACITVFHKDPHTISVDLLFKKTGGPHEHFERQMYILAYLKSDEAEIMKLASDPSLLDKNAPDKKMVLDVLLEKKFVAILETKAVIRNNYDPVMYRDVIVQKPGKNADNDEKANLEWQTYPFKFTFTNEELFKTINQLANFHADNVVNSDDVYFNEKFCFLAFVPVNDSKYASKIPAEMRKSLDFAGLPGNYKTPLLYFRPLPYELQFAKTRLGEIKIYIN